MQLLTDVHFDHQERITAAEPFTRIQCETLLSKSGGGGQSRKTIYMRLYMWENLTLFLWVFCWDIINLTHCGWVTQICVFNMVKLGTSASSP